MPRTEAAADAFYLDGFSPALNPELWSPEVCRSLARLALPEATLATWSVAGGVRRALSPACDRCWSADIASIDSPKRAGQLK